MFEKFTDRARMVMALATQEAQRFKHEYIGSEHLLLGLVKEDIGTGYAVLRKLDVDIKKVRPEVEKIVKSGSDIVTRGKLPQTPRAKKIIEYAIEEARAAKHNYVATGHILLGMLREEEGNAFQVLTSFGLKIDDVRREVLALQGEEVPLIEEDPTKWESAVTLTLLIDPGGASAEEISQLFLEISTLYRMVGGSGVNFTIVDAKEPAVA